MVDGFWVGADPGGKDKFGLAFLDTSGGTECLTISSVEEALERIADKGKLLGLGIDAPMWWSSRAGGWRRADERLREQYPEGASSVLAINSLRGAALVGGAMLAFRVREKFPGARVTESYPKALLRALRLDEPGFAAKFRICIAWRNEHERDALIAAVCAREGFEGRWATDLAVQRDDSEQDPRSYWLAPMRYFWPELM